MARKKKEQFIDMGRVESEKFEPTEEVRTEFDEAAQLGSAGQLIEKLRKHHSTSPALSGGDIDAAWEDADVGEESVAAKTRLLIRMTWKSWAKQSGLFMKTASRCIRPRR